MINPCDRVYKQDIFRVFIYDLLVDKAYTDKKYNFIKDFHLKESLINKYNKDMDKTYTCISQVQEYINDKSIYPVSEEDAKLIIQAAIIQAEKDNIPCTSEVMISIANQYLSLMNSFEYYYENNIKVAAKPVIWDITRKHDSYMQEQLEVGEQMEVFVEREFSKSGVDIGRLQTPSGQNHGETKIGVEIKHDMRSKDTSNFYIELSETHKIYNNRDDNNGIADNEYTNKNDYYPSGIMKDDNSKFYLLGTPENYYIVTKEALLNEFDELLLKEVDELDFSRKWYKDKRLADARGSHGFLIKESRLKEIAVSNDISDFAYRYFRNYIPRDTSILNDFSQDNRKNQNRKENGPDL